jgi:hypothetical protein
LAEKIKITKTENGVEVIGNREGLMGMAEVCLRLAMLPENETEARKLGNHYHYAEWANNTEQGSADVLIVYKPEL